MVRIKTGWRSLASCGGGAGLKGKGYIGAQCPQLQALDHQERKKKARKTACDGWQLQKPNPTSAGPGSLIPAYRRV